MKINIDLIIAYINIFKPDIKTMPIPVIDLSFKEWIDDDGKAYSPNDVLDNKSKYKDDYDRIMNADLRYLIVLFNSDFLADGVHRLVKATLQKAKTIRYVNFSPKSLKAFAVTKGQYERNACYEAIEIFVTRVIPRVEKRTKKTNITSTNFSQNRSLLQNGHMYHNTAYVQITKD